YADLLVQRGVSAAPPTFSVTNVNSHSLGVVGIDPQTGRRRNQVLIPKNTPLPHTVSRVFKTHRANQSSVAVRVVEGESERPEACTEVGVCTIRNLPADLAAGWPVQVSYTYQENGRLHVSAKLKGHQAAVTMDFVRANSLSENDLGMWLEYVILQMGRKG